MLCGLNMSDSDRHSSKRVRVVAGSPSYSPTSPSYPSASPCYSPRDDSRRDDSIFHDAADRPPSPGGSAVDADRHINTAAWLKHYDHITKQIEAPVARFVLADIVPRLDSDTIAAVPGVPLASLRKLVCAKLINELSPYAGEARETVDALSEDTCLLLLGAFGYTNKTCVMPSKIEGGGDGLFAVSKIDAGDVVAVGFHSCETVDSYHSTIDDTRMYVVCDVMSRAGAVVPWADAHKINDSAADLWKLRHGGMEEFAVNYVVGLGVPPCNTATYVHTSTGVYTPYDVPANPAPGWFVIVRASVSIDAGEELYTRYGIPNWRDRFVANDLPDTLPCAAVFGAAVVSWKPPVTPDSPVTLAEYPERHRDLVKDIREGVRAVHVFAEPTNPDKALYGLGCLVRIALESMARVRCHPRALPYDAADVVRFCAIFGEYLHSTFDYCFSKKVMCDLTNYLQINQAGVYYDLWSMRSTTIPSVLAVQFIAASAVYRDAQ